MRSHINEGRMIGTLNCDVVPCKGMGPEITEEPCFLKVFAKPLHNRRFSQALHVDILGVVYSHFRYFITLDR